MPAQIRLVPCLSDNYAVLLHDPETLSTAVIDAPHAAPIISALDKEGWTLTHVLITHHHADHIQAIPELKARYRLQVVGPEAAGTHIPGVDLVVEEGSEGPVGALSGRVLATPGHTRDHVAYVFDEDKLLFAGDTLFSLGCGRAFECEPAVLWHSLLKLRALPDDLQLYCGHEYTLSNARFALSVDPDNSALQARMAEVERLRAACQPTLPVRLGEEKKTNPFLRADDPALAARLGMAGASAEDVFTELRERKNGFRG